MGNNSYIGDPMLIDIIKKDGFTFYKPDLHLAPCALELTEQVNLINWLSYNHPSMFYFATVNERNSSIVNMQKLKRQGLVTGVPDLYLALDGKTMFIEMKKHNGKFSDLRKTQRDVITELSEQGQTTMVCFGFLAAKQAIEEYFNLCSK